MIRLVILLCLLHFVSVSFSQDCTNAQLQEYRETYIRPAFGVRAETPAEAIAKIDTVIIDIIPALPATCQNELLATAYNVKALAQKYKEDFSSARQSFQKALSLTADESEKGKFYLNICGLEKTVGRYDTALLYCDKAVILLQKDKADTTFLAQAYINTANVFIEKKPKDLDRANYYFDKARAITKNEAVIKDAEFNQAVVLIRAKQYQEALVLLNKCKDYYTRKNEELNLGRVEEALGELYYKKKVYKRAKKFFEKSLDLYRSTDTSRQNPNSALLHLGLTLYELNSFKKALAVAQQIQFSPESNLEDQWRLQRLFTDLYIELRELNLASKYFNTAEALRKRLEKKAEAVGEISVEQQESIDQAMLSYSQGILNNKEKRRDFRQFMLNTSLSGTTLISAIVALFFYAISKKRKADSEHQQAVNQEAEQRYQTKINGIFKDLREDYLKEKKHANRQIHDDICPGIVNIQREVEYYLTIKDKREYDLDNVIKLCQINYSKLRSLIDRGLNGKEVEEEWLWHISLMIKQQKRNGNLEVDTYIEKENLRSLPAELGNQLARITCILIENIEKYAQATEMSYNLLGSDGEVVLIVEDDGIGFDKAELQRKQKDTKASLGLQHVKSRVQEKNGQIDIDTAPNEGTKITITIPV